MTETHSSGVTRRGFIAGGVASAAVIPTMTTASEPASAIVPNSGPTTTATKALPAGTLPAGTLSAGTFAMQLAGTLPVPDSIGQVNALAATGAGLLAVAHGKGLSIWDDAKWQLAGTDPTYSVAWSGGQAFAVSGGELVIASKRDGIWRATTRRLPRGVDGARALLESNGTDVYLAFGTRLFRYRSGWPSEKLPGVATALAVGSRVAIAVENLAYERSSEGTWSPLPFRNDPISFLSYDKNNRLWFAGSNGVGVLGENPRYADDPPMLDFTALAPGATGDIWLGTPRGTLHLDKHTWEYRQGRRWLPDDNVRAITTDASGKVFLATGNSIATINPTPTTFEDKSKHFEAAIDARHRRTQWEFIVPANLTTPGDLTRFTKGITDNDGLWTSMYGAAEAFRYAVTKDDEAYRKARKVFEALRFLGDVTQGGEHPAPPGFVARAVQETGGVDPNIRDSPERDRQKQASDALWKVVVPRWPVSADGKWYWKSDTSNDELVGHFFFHALFHDLVTKNADERQEAAAVISRMVDHLIDHGFALIDHSGTPTRWGFFQPKELNDNPWRREERGLNSQSILTYLSIAEHVSGATKYSDAKRKLIEDHGYAMNLFMPKVTWGLGGGNQSDDEMAFMNYYHLLSYEKDAKLKQAFARSLFDYWHLEQAEANPFFNFVAAAGLKDMEWRDAYGPVKLDMTGPWLEQSADTLRRLTLDRVEWRQANSHRKDLVLLAPYLRPDDDPGTVGLRKNGTVLPVDERAFTWWNHDPYELDTGGEGTREADGTSFLLPYWMGRYLGLGLGDTS